MPSFRTPTRTIQLNISQPTRLAALALTTAVSMTAANAAVKPPQYSAGISVQSDVGYLDDGSPLRVGYPLFGDSPQVSLSPVDLSFSHVSYLRSASTGTAYAGPDNGGTVRAIARTGDEDIGAQAGLTYTFQLQAKAGVVLPAVLPLSVLANGYTGTENYSSARIIFILSWADSATTTQTIFKDTAVVSGPGGISTDVGNGKIDINETINVVPNRDISLQISAAAHAGIPVSDRNLNQDEYGTGSAYLDPVFTLPAEFRDLVNIVGVPAAPVPEPASWALMLCGIAVVGGTVLRHRRQSRGRQISADKLLATPLNFDVRLLGHPSGLNDNANFHRSTHVR